MLLDLSLTLSAVSILALTSSSSSDVSRRRDDSSFEGRELHGGGGLLDGGAGGGGSVPLPIVTCANGFAYPGTEGMVMLSLAGIFGRDRPYGVGRGVAVLMAAGCCGRKVEAAS